MAVARLLLVLALLGGAPGARAEACHLLARGGARELSAADLRARPVAFPFGRGERLEYAVRYFGIDIGRAGVEVARFIEWDGRRLAHVVAWARTNAVISALYRVDDRSEAWIDADRLVTVRTATHTRHGRRREIYEEVDFDWKSHYVRIFEARRHAGDAHRVEFDFGPFVHDTFDVLYALRSLPLAPGDRVRVPVYASQKVYGFELSVGAAQPIRSAALGEVPALVVRPRNTLDGKPQDDGRGVVWVSADARHLPLRGRGWFRSTQGWRIGGLQAELVAYTPGQPHPRPAGPSPRPVAPPPPPSVEGRPVWDPPAKVLARRKRRDFHPLDRRFDFAWPATVGCPESEPAPSGAQSSKSDA